MMIRVFGIAENVMSYLVMSLNMSKKKKKKNLGHS